ncbi:hypothetical protein GCM10027514_05730 [Azotobacter armeniacus]
MDMRGADEMGDTILHGEAGQLQGSFHVWRAVVEAGKQVVVQVEHICGWGSVYVGCQAAGLRSHVGAIAYGK